MTHPRLTNDADSLIAQPELIEVCLNCKWRKCKQPDGCTTYRAKAREVMQRIRDERRQSHDKGHDTG